MKTINMIFFRLGLVGLMFSNVMAQSDSLSQQYCSNENTGSDYTPKYSIYMSMGKCFDFCKADYAFAVVQDKNCWCSNYIPSAQDSTDQCSQSCPGFPGDLCGNSQENLYGYIPLYKSPSGTAGAPSSAPPTSSAPPATSEPPPPPPTTTTSYTPSSTPPVSSDPASSSAPPTSSAPPATSEPPPPPTTTTSYVSHYVTRTHTITTKKTQPPEVVTSYVTPTPSSTPPVSSDPASSSAPVQSSSGYSSSSDYPIPSSSSPSPTPETTVRVITKSGSVVTQTVTQTPIIIGGGSGASSSPEHMQVQQQPLSGGAIAGIVIGSLIGLAAILLAAFLLWRRKKNADSEQGAVAGGTKRPKRNTSVLSRTGLLARGRPQSMSENNYDDNVDGPGSNSVRHSMMFGAGATVEGVSPASPLGGSQDNISSPASARRYSRPMVYDQRLNPSALFANPDANGSRVSMQDQNDYSRPLGVANPDSFRASFDSR